MVVWDSAPNDGCGAIGKKRKTPKGSKDGRPSEGQGLTFPAEGSASHGLSTGQLPEGEPQAPEWLLFESPKQA